MRPSQIATLKAEVVELSRDARLGEMQKQVFTKVVESVDLENGDDLVDVLTKSETLEEGALTPGEREVLQTIVARQQEIKLPYLRKRFQETFRFYGDLSGFERHDLLTVKSVAHLMLVCEEDIEQASQDLGVPSTKLIEMKFQANLQMIADIPPAIFRAIKLFHYVSDTSLSSMSEFVTYDPDALSEQLADKVRIYLHINENSEITNVKQAMLALNLSEAELARANGYIESNQAAFEENPVDLTNQLLKEILPFKFTEAMIAVRSALTHTLQTSGRESRHQCQWDKSRFSEMAYLDYLMKNYGYSVQDVKNLLEEPQLVPVEEVGRVSYSHHWHRVTAMTQAIAAVQNDIRKERRFKKEVIFYPTYESWVGAQLDERYPENNFPTNAEFYTQGLKLFDRVDLVVQAVNNRMREIDSSYKKETTDGDLGKISQALTVAFSFNDDVTSLLEIYKILLASLNGLFIYPGQQSFESLLGELRGVVGQLRTITLWPSQQAQFIFSKELFDARSIFQSNFDSFDYNNYQFIMRSIRKSLLNENYMELEDFVQSYRGSRNGLNSRLYSSFAYLTKLIQDLNKIYEKKIDASKIHEISELNDEMEKTAFYWFPYCFFYLVPLLTAYAQKELGHYEEAARQILLIFDYKKVDEPNFSPESVLPFPLSRDELNFAVLTLAEIWIAHTDYLYREDTYESIQHAKQLYEWVLKLFPKENENYIDIRQEVNKKLDTILESSLITPEMKHRVIDRFYQTDILPDSDVVEGLDVLLTEINRLEGDANTVAINEAVSLSLDENFQGLREPERNADPSGELITDLVKRQRESVELLRDSYVSEMALDVQQLSEASLLNPLGVVETPLEILPPEIDDVELETAREKRKKADWLSRMKYELAKLCDYPNPRILRVLEEASMRLQGIKNFQNYLGYQEDDRLVYTVDRLYREFTHYNGLAKQYAQRMMRHQESAESEKEKYARATLDIESAKGMVDVRGLEVEQKVAEVKAATTDQERAQTDLDYEKKQLAYYEGNAPWSAILGEASLAAAGGAVGGLAVGGPFAPAAAAIGAAVAFIGALFNGLMNKEKMKKELKQKVKMAEHRLDRAKQALSIAKKRLEASEQSLRIAKLTLMLNEQFLDLLENQVLNAAAYFHLRAQAKALVMTYIDMAIRYAWLMQQQLAFEHGVPLNLVAFNYRRPGESSFKSLLTAAQTLEQTVEGLRSESIIHAQPRIVLQRTFSLRNEFPVQFLEFLKTGRLTFSTSVDHFKFDLIEQGSPGQTKKMLEYQGHLRHPRHLGHLQQRIDHVEFRLIGLVRPAADLRLQLTNVGHSLVMTKNPSNGQPRLVPLRHPSQTVIFDRPQQSTNTDYARFSAQGELKPFEKIGVDTTWQLGLNARSVNSPLASIFDAQMIVHYTAQYDPGYELVQKATEMRGEENNRRKQYVYLPNDGSDSHTILLRESYAQVYYKFQTPTYTEPGFRDLRFVTFEIEYDIPDWQRSPRLSTMHFYLSPKEKARLTGFELPYTEVNTVEGEPAFFLQHRVKLVSELEDPITGETNPIQGLAYTADLEQATDEKRDLEKYSNRRCTLKFFPELFVADPNQAAANEKNYLKQDRMGQLLNTRGQVAGIFSAPLKDDVLNMNTIGESSGETVELVNLPQSQLDQWAQYHWEIKMRMLKSGEVNLQWMVEKDQYLFLKIDPLNSNGKTLQLGAKKRQDAFPQDKKDLLSFMFAKKDWYHLSVLSIPMGSKTYVEFYLDKQLLWKGQLDIETKDHPGGIRLITEKDVEVDFDDLLIQSVDASGCPIRRLFSDTFTSQAKWDANQPNTPDERTLVWRASDRSRVTLAKDANPEMDLTPIADVVHSINYQYQCGPQA